MSEPFDDPLSPERLQMAKETIEAARRVAEFCREFDAIPTTALTCKACGKSFSVPAGDKRMLRRQFCSDACKSKDYRSK